MITLKGQTETSEKRFYFDAQLKMECPNCGEEMERNFNDNYLSYPKVGKKAKMSLYCHGCDKEFAFPYKVKAIDVVLEYDETKVEEYGA